MWHNWLGLFLKPNLARTNGLPLGEAENGKGAKNGYSKSFGSPLEML